MRTIACPLKNYEVIDMDHYTEEAAVLDGKAVKYTDSQHILGDNFTATECDPLMFCEVYQDVEGQDFRQCPQTQHLEQQLPPVQR